MIGIVGGGITGLALGHRLAREGADWSLWEAEERAGGILRTVRVEGHPLDLGAQRTRLTAEVRELVEELGLEDELVVADEDLGLQVYRDGRLRDVPFSLGEAASTDLISWRGKLRILAEPLTAGLREDETAEAFFVRKLGLEAYESLVGPLYGGLYASDPARMPARHALAGALRTFGVGRSLLVSLVRRRRRKPPPTVTFRDGMEALPRALAETHAPRVRLGSPVRRLAREGEGWRVEGPWGHVVAERIVLATPAPVSAGLLETVAPGAAGRLRALRYNDLAVVHLRGDCDLDGFGYQVAFGEPLETRGVTFNASAFGRDGIYTVYLGGMRNPDLVEWPDERIGEMARDELLEVTGCATRVLQVGRTRIPAWDESWDALEGLELPGGVDLCGNYLGRPGVPGRVGEARRLAEGLTGGR